MNSAALCPVGVFCRHAKKGHRSGYLLEDVGKVLGAHDRMSESLERAFGEAPGYPLEQPDRPGVVYGRREAVGDGHFGAALMSRRDALGEAAQVLANDPAPFGRKRTYRAGQAG